MGEAIGSGGGVEIECWREVVPVLFHEARRLTVHVQFRSIKFSMLRREFHIKLSSEEDHCFLYKTAVTQDVYQRFAHYHSLDVPFEQFSEYMHHLIHSVKNNQDFGDRFFINILAPQTPTNSPQTVEFIVTQGQMGCLVQCRRLSLTFKLASDAELKEHLISCFDRLKKEKDVVQRRCNELDNELMHERTKNKELDERNKYFQRELEFSQSLIKSAENLQRHYESLLRQQHQYRLPASTATPTSASLNFQSQNHHQQQHHFPHHHRVTFLEEKPPPTMPQVQPNFPNLMSLGIDPADANLLMPDHIVVPQNQGLHHHQSISLMSHHNDPDPHFDNVINFLTSNCATINSSSTLNNTTANGHELAANLLTTTGSMNPVRPNDLLSVVDHRPSESNAALNTTTFQQLMNAADAQNHSSRKMAVDRPPPPPITTKSSVLNGGRRCIVPPSPILTAADIDDDNGAAVAQPPDGAVNGGETDSQVLTTPVTENAPINQFVNIRSDQIQTLDNQLSNPCLTVSDRSAHTCHNSSHSNIQTFSTPSVNNLTCANNNVANSNNSASSNVHQNGDLTKKLKGAAKRKASFHNLTNGGNNAASNQVNSSAEQQQVRNDGGQQHHVTERPRSDELVDSKVNLQVQQQRQQQQLEPNVQDHHHHHHLQLLSAADLMYCQTRTAGDKQQGHVTLNGQDDRNLICSRNGRVNNNDNIDSNNMVDAFNGLISQGPTAPNMFAERRQTEHQHLQQPGNPQQPVSFMENESYRNYLGGDDINRVVNNQNTSMSPTLGSTNNELIDNLSGLTEADWRNMKIEYDSSATFPMDLAEVGGPDNPHNVSLNEDMAANMLSSLPVPQQQQQLAPANMILVNGNGVATTCGRGTPTTNAPHRKTPVVGFPPNLVAPAAIGGAATAECQSPLIGGQAMTSSSSSTSGRTSGANFIDRSSVTPSSHIRLEQLLTPQQQQMSGANNAACVVDPACRLTPNQAGTPCLLRIRSDSADETKYTPPSQHGHHHQQGGSEISPSPDPKNNVNLDGVLSYFKCLICETSFNVGPSHMLQHLSADTQTCNFCNDTTIFESSDEMLKHLMTHSARIYACQYCGKENPRVHYLKIHVRSHTGEKPYTCHQCGRGFADASTWRRHERVHTGEKPYQCNICGRKIARRDNVKIHMRSHMRTKHQAACRVCGKGFSQPNHLLLHERVCMTTAGSSSPGLIDLPTSPMMSSTGGNNRHPPISSSGNSANVDLDLISGIATQDVKCKPSLHSSANNADGVVLRQEHSSSSPMNIIAAIEADASKMLEQQQGRSFVG